MDKVKADTVMHDISAAIAGVLEMHGLDRVKTRGKYGDADLTVTITLTEAAPEGELFNPNSYEAKAFTAGAALRDLDPELLGKRVRIAGREFVVSGLNPRASKNCVLLVDDDGRQFHTTAGSLRPAEVLS